MINQKSSIGVLSQDSHAPKGFLAELIAQKLEAKSKIEALSDLESQTLALIRFDRLSEVEREALGVQLLKLNLLSDGQVNPKTAKELAGYHFENFILHLTPSDLSGFNLCPAASIGCRAACLNGAGRGRFDSIQTARLRKTLYFVKYRDQFLKHLDRELTRIVKAASKSGAKIAIRLNGTSDIPWENVSVRDGKSFMELYQNVTFYDYTKLVNRIKSKRFQALKNYSLTVSASETNWTQCVEVLNSGVNVACVFDQVPKTFEGFKVLDGDAHDFRFLDKTSKVGFLIGLKAKGTAKRDASGFVKRVSKCQGQAA